MPGQVQQGPRTGSGEVKFNLVQSQARFERVPDRRRFRRRFRKRFREALVPEKVPAAGFAARFRKICKNKTLRLGIPTEAYFSLWSLVRFSAPVRGLNEQAVFGVELITEGLEPYHDFVHLFVYAFFHGSPISCVLPC